MTAKKAVRSSFRDPSGFVFFENGSVYRQINKSYSENYRKLIDSGLYKRLVDSNLLIPHEEAGHLSPDDSIAHTVIRPDRLHFISYPYEWCFSQLRDAALTTLEVQKTALEYGMTLKDSSAFNIQFHRGKPILIDTLSFDTHEDGRPWIAYRQFCQHFLAPLALMSYCDVRLSQLLKTYLDGIPLDLASSLLPAGSRMRPGLLAHIHLHSRSQRRYADRSVSSARKMGGRALRGLIDSLETAVRKLSWKPVDTEWADYYRETNYSDEAFEQKKGIVGDLLERVAPKTVWDVGANTGCFSRIASDQGIDTISFDIDPAAVEKNYLDCRRDSVRNCLPLLIDLTNPTPGIGWMSEERASLIKRRNADCVMALALVHHLAISGNVPLGMIAEFFSLLCNSLIIEFIPKEDSQTQRLLRSREDIFPDYTEEGFERAFGEYFVIGTRNAIADSSRVLYMMTAKKGRGA